MFTVHVAAQTHRITQNTSIDRFIKIDQNLSYNDAFLKDLRNDIHVLYRSICVCYIIGNSACLGLGTCAVFIKALSLFKAHYPLSQSANILNTQKPVLMHHLRK